MLYKALFCNPRKLNAAFRKKPNPNYHFDCRLAGDPPKDVWTPSTDTVI